MVTLTKKINGTYRSKLKTRTPVVIPIPREQAEMMKRVPRLSLDAIRDGEGNSTDWYNVTFRINISLILAKKFYTDEASIALEEIAQLCLAIAENYAKTDKWSVTPEQYEMFIMGLDASDQIQDETTRRELLDASLASRTYVNKLIKTHNEKLSMKCQTSPIS